VGALCASYALEQIGTQSHHFTLQQFIERFRSQADDDGRLDQLPGADTRQGSLARGATAKGAEDGE